jgi:hypothetical protein
VDRLAKIRLDLTIAQNYDFFGISINPTLHIATSTPPARILSTVVTLNCLDLFFNSPYDYR